MADITFAQLTEIYRRATFNDEGAEATFTIETQEILSLLQRIESNAQAAGDSRISLLEIDAATLTVGQTITVQVGAPKIALGALVRNFDKLLLTQKAYMAEPASYFVIDGKLEPSTTPPAQVQVNYRKILKIVDLFKQAASYVDEMKQELVFIREGKFTIPVRYSEETVKVLASEDADSLLKLFDDNLHTEQKLSILIEALAHTSEAQPEAKRFRYILDNLKSVADEMSNGYKLFISSFSYSKIRTEIADKKIEYVGKIHKTLTDIQGQLLGIPVATVIAATQLKLAPKCGLDFWTNVGVLAGVWAFVILLMISIINQRHTLISISDEVNNQQFKLRKEYASISDQFNDLFISLSKRICWHKATLWVIGIVALLGAGISTYAYAHLNTAGFSTCAFAEQPLEKAAVKTTEQSTIPAATPAKTENPAEAAAKQNAAQVPKPSAPRPTDTTAKPHQDDTTPKKQPSK